MPDKRKILLSAGGGFFFHYKNRSYNINVFPFLFFVLQSMYCMYLGLKKKNVGGGVCAN